MKTIALFIDSSRTNIQNVNVKNMRLPGKGKGASKVFDEKLKK